MYGQKILGLDLSLTRQFKEALFEGNEVLRVGFTRVNFSYFFNEDDVKYVLDAIEFICKYGWMLLPHYKFD
jgi:selenocysteine lyase/cysteine desulfurase